MERFDEQRRADVAPATVWTVLTDPHRVPTWLTIAQRVEAQGDAGPGQQLHITGGHLGVSRTLELTVDVWEPTAAYGWSTGGPLPLWFRFKLSPDGDGTHLSTHVEVDLTGLPRVATQLAVRSLRREFDRSATRLTQLAERS